MHYTQISKQHGAHTVLVDVLKICVSIKYCSSVGELIRKFPFLILGGKCRITNNKC
jgi:hypothetical protein